MMHCKGPWVYSAAKAAIPNGLSSPQTQGIDGTMPFIIQQQALTGSKPKTMVSDGQTWITSALPERTHIIVAFETCVITVHNMGSPVIAIIFGQRLGKGERVLQA